MGRENKRLEDLNTVIQTFAQDYHCIFLVNFQTDEISVYQATGEYKDWIRENACLGYQKCRDNFVNKFIACEDKKWFLELTDIESVKKQFENENTYILNHQIVNNGRACYYQTKFIRLYEDSVDYVLIGGHSIDNAEQNGLNQIKEITVAHQNAVIAGLSNDFDYVCYINLRTEEVIRFRATDKFAAILNKVKPSQNVLERVNSFLKLIVYQDDLEGFLRNIDKAKVMNELKNHSSYEVYFRAIIEGKVHHYLCKFVQDTENPNGIIVGFIVCDRQKREEMHRKEQEYSRRAMEKQLELTITERTSEIQEKNKALNRINEDIIELLGDITEARDIESGEHIRRVKGFTHILAEQVMRDWPQFDLTPDKVELMTSASALHDIGKIMIPDAILLKPGRLTEDEFEKMKSHCVNGCEILKKAPQDWSASYLNTSMEICRWHHEKYDGKGYPDGLKGEEIPISAQIVSVADCFDALSSKRVYKEKFEPDKAYSMIVNGECGAFSEKILHSFKKCRDAFIQHVANINSVNFSDLPAGINSCKLTNTHILFVEDNEMSREIGKELLEQEGAIVTVATNGREALEIFENNRQKPFDAILMDVMMPDISGPETARIMRNLNVPNADTVPIIALTASTDRNDIQHCLDAGMSFYLTKPIKISALSKVLIECMKNQSGSLQQKLIKVLKSNNNDPMTGVKNITAYTEMIEDLTLEIQNDESLEFAIVICDVNGLSAINSTYGHDMGDFYIKNCCNLISEVFEDNEIYRVAGNEFVILLKDIEYLNRQILIDTLKKKILEASKKTDIAHGKTDFAVGMAEYDPVQDQTISSVMRRADLQMYNNKRLMKFESSVQ